jgi:gliding motility-associated-like protein
MNKNNYILYTALKTFVFCVFLVLPWAVKSQNYISSNSEISIFSSVDLSSSASWETSRLSNPGFFTWLDNAELYEGATDVFHVNGYVKKTGNDGFVFPVGNGIDLRTLQMSAPSSISSEYAVAWISGNPTSTPDPTNNNELHSTLAFSGVITAVSPIGQWDWLAINDTGEGLIITVSIPALTGDFFTNSADVRLIGWNGTSWVNLGTTGASGLTENSTLSGTMTAGIQAIGIGSIKTAAPLVKAPTLVVEQNKDGSLLVNGTADAGNSVLITFPDGSTLTVIANSQGVFGPVSSVLPQVLKSFVTAVATNSTNVKSNVVVVNYEFQPQLYISEAFTPNGDGINDTWMIYQLENFPNTTVRVYNRWGHEVFYSNNYQNDWDGHFNNSSATLPDSGSYYYQIDFSSNGSVDKQGWLYIKR